MTDRELMELILQKVTSTETKITSMETKITSMETDLAAVKNSVEAIRTEVAGLAEFRTDTEEMLLRHEIDIKILKKIAAN